MSIPVGSIIAIAAQAFDLFMEAKKALEADGMTAEEFDAAIAAERARVSKWLADSDAAEDALFKKKPEKELIDPKPTTGPYR